MTAEELFNFLNEKGLEKSVLVMQTTGGIENIKVTTDYKVTYDSKGMIQIDKSHTTVYLSTGR